MSFDEELDDALHPDNLGMVGEQEDAPVDPARIAAPTAPVIAPTIATQPAAQTPYDAPPSAGIATHRVTLSPAEQANLGAIDDATAARKETAGAEGDLAVDRAVDKAANAQAEADLKVSQAHELERLQAEQQKIIDERHHRDEVEYQKYREMGLKDPDADKGFGHRIAAALAIGLGQYSAAMNHTQNEAANIFATARKENLALQQAAIEKQKDASIRAGQDVQQAKADAAQALHNLQIKNVAQIDAFKTRFAAESERLGIPAARIQASKVMQDIDKQALEAREKHLESTRTFSRDPTPKELRAGKGGGGGGSAGDDKLYEYLRKNPGDLEGVSKLAQQLNIPSKRLDKVITNSKGTESQTKDAKQSAIGLRAVDAIEKSGYTPSKAAVQKWMDNQRKIALTNKDGVVGGGAAIAQSLGVIPQSETDGLSPKAAEYFSNVRRFMETIGRAQSGAAISNSEWQNFFNQYGPNSAGGLGAARKYLEDQARVSGVPGRQLDVIREPKGDTPKAAPPPGDDAKAARRALAQQAIDDPSATPKVKARALQILREK